MQASRVRKGTREQTRSQQSKKYCRTPTHWLDTESGSDVTSEGFKRSIAALASALWLPFIFTGERSLVKVENLPLSCSSVALDPVCGSHTSCHVITDYVALVRATIIAEASETMPDLELTLEP
ncbi:hypothetical protein RRG08_019235 [Elysia crispata]|uniref:Uncharacterized protein n=1 Tax=Elysia crispata TaxID=231223 RepID=A0AAE1AVF1_9GAST|nr:hypothetical protein RRG08_019235 [Elysia crispata]